MNNIENKKRTHPKKRRRVREEIKTLNRRILAGLIIINIILSCVTLSLATDNAEAPNEGESPEIEQTVIHTTEEVNKAAIEVEETHQEPIATFSLTSEQRTLIEQVVAAESIGEPYEGQVAVAQCILNACKKDGITPEQAIEEYNYTSRRAEPSDSVKKAVSAVFEHDDSVTEEPIIYFYAPDRVTSDWHESQIFVIEIGNHRFFKEANKK